MTGRTGVQYVVDIKRQLGDPRWVRAQLRKRWFNVSERQSESKVYAETWLDVSGMTEAETLAAVLGDLRLCVLDLLG